MSAESYTQEQILSGIRVFWREVLRCDSSFDMDSRIDRHLCDYKFVDWIGLNDGPDFSEIVGGLEEHFGFSCSWKEWESYFYGPIQNQEEWEQIVAPPFTFRRLVEFIRERVKPISLQPIALLGNPCLTAGVFRGLEQLVRQISPNATKFAPGTPIRRCLRVVLIHVFWNRLRWMFEDQLPPPRRITLSSRGFLHSLLFKFGIGLAVALWKRNLSGLLAGIFTTFALFIPLGVIVAFINAGMNPLPKGIETFGDLARVLAAIILDQQSEAASCSTP